MKFSNRTIDVLDNISNLLQVPLFLPKGTEGEYTEIQIAAKPITSPHIVAKAWLQEVFPIDVRIADVGTFLNILKRSKGEAEVSFSDNFMTIKIGNGKVKFFYGAPDVVQKFDKKPKYPDKIATFTLGENDFKQLNTYASVLKLADVSIIKMNDKEIEIRVQDDKIDINNQFALTVPANFESPVMFDYKTKIENLNFLPGQYEVTVYDKFLLNCKQSNALLLEYNVMMKKISTAGETDGKR